MEARLILSRLFILIYKTRYLRTFDHDDFIRTILGIVSDDGGEKSILGKSGIQRLKEFCIELLKETEQIEIDAIEPTLKLILENDQKLLDTILEGVLVEQDEGTIKRVIGSHVKSLSNYYKEYKATELINRLSYDLKFNRNKVGNFSEYLKQTIAELEPLANQTTSLKDPAVVNEMDFEDNESVDAVFEEVRNLNNNNSLYKFGFKALNRMTQGGIRRGEFCTIGSLQHNYKTGLSLSMFIQTALHNKPVVTKAEEGKKPLLLRISFEDSLTNNLQFMYQYLYSAENPDVTTVEIDTLSIKDMRDYVISRMTKTGFKIKMLRVDPSQWTYSDVFNKVIELESQGYAVHLLMLDYIGKIPTTGCVQGPTGTDFRDLLRRMRNFCSARNIALVSPLQLSSDAKRLLRNGTPQHLLVKEVADLGYYAGSTQLDQEIDCELFSGLVKTKGKTYLSVQRGKHRLPTMIEEKDMYFLLPFPNRHLPIRPDIDGEDSSLDRLPRGNFGNDKSNDDLLAEVLG